MKKAHQTMHSVVTGASNRSQLPTVGPSTRNHLQMVCKNATGPKRPIAHHSVALRGPAPPQPCLLDELRQLVKVHGSVGGLRGRAVRAGSLDLLGSSAGSDAGPALQQGAASKHRHRVLPLIWGSSMPIHCIGNAIRTHPGGAGSPASAGDRRAGGRLCDGCLHACNCSE